MSQNASLNRDTQAYYTPGMQRGPRQLDGIGIIDLSGGGGRRSDCDSNDVQTIVNKADYDRLPHRPRRCGALSDEGALNRSKGSVLGVESAAICKFSISVVPLLRLTTTYLLYLVVNSLFLGDKILASQPPRLDISRSYDCMQMQNRILRRTTRWCA